jgi:hypothetical protein
MAAGTAGGTPAGGSVLGIAAVAPPDSGIAAVAPPDYGRLSRHPAVSGTDPLAVGSFDPLEVWGTGPLAVQGTDPPPPAPETLQRPWVAAAKIKRHFFGIRLIGTGPRFLHAMLYICLFSYRDTKRGIYASRCPKCC